MRAWDIAFFFILISFAGAWVNELGLFYGTSMPETPIKTAEWANSQTFNSTYVQPASPAPSGTVSITDTLSSLLGGGWFLFQAIGFFIKLVSTAIAFPVMLRGPPVFAPDIIWMTISAICYVSYGAAIIEFLSARRIGA